MQNVIRTLAGVLLAFFSCAQAYARTEYQATIGTNDSDWSTSYSSACSGALAKAKVGTPSDSSLTITSCTATGGTYQYSRPSTFEETTGNIGMRTRDVPGDCDADSDMVNGVCVKRVCPKDGTNTSVNLTTGWARGPDNAAGLKADIKVPNANQSALYNNTSCGVLVDRTRPTMCYQSQEPAATGLYRLSCDFAASYTGKAVTVRPDDETRMASDSNEPPPACDGYQGTIGNKPVCIAKTPESNKPVPPAVDSAKTVTGNPTAGSTSEKSIGDRQPSYGNGSNLGGPSTAGDGATLIRGAGTGNYNGATADANGKVATTQGKEQQNCGAPNQPKCRIDETGTPEGKGTADDATKQAKAGHEKVLETINGAKDKQAPAWTFSFRLPTGCTPILLDAFGIQTITIDPCRWQSQIHDIMAMIWLGVTAWTLIAMVGRTLHTA